MKATFLTILAAIFLTACGQNAANNSLPKNQTAAAAVNQKTAPPDNQAMPIPQNSAAMDKSKIKNFDGKGVVVRINGEIGSVALDHEEIKGLMPAMEGMEFYVSDKKMLENLKIGDRVDFVLEDDAGAERIIKITRK